ncbi:hypothetical protein BDZ97DRAFT_482352 [Flammula alnicola]|nr:hypothetical protein BDZ97DRAFT_482352 [Flammula alnicola]
MGNTTPSLVSDSDSPSPSSPSVTSQISLPRDLASPPESPNSIENRTIPQNMEDEDALVSATQAMGIDPNRKIATAQSTQEPPSLIYVDASNQTLETLPPMPQGSVPATESVASSNTLRTAHSSNSDSSNSEQQAEEDKLNDDTFEPGSEPRHGKQKTSRKLNGQFKCQQCPMTFTRNFDMLRHIKSIHEAQTEDKKLALTCPSCYEVLSRSDAFKRHVVKVPASCVRLSKLLGKERPPAQPESLYDLCRGGHPPLADLLNRPLP